MGRGGKPGRSPAQAGSRRSKEHAQPVAWARRVGSLGMVSPSNRRRWHARRRPPGRPRSRLLRRPARTAAGRPSSSSRPTGSGMRKGNWSARGCSRSSSANSRRQRASRSRERAGLRWVSGLDDPRVAARVTSKLDQGRPTSGSFEHPGARHGSCPTRRAHLPELLALAQALGCRRWLEGKGRRIPNARPVANLGLLVLGPCAWEG